MLRAVLIAAVLIWTATLAHAQKPVTLPGSVKKIDGLTTLDLSRTGIKPLAGDEDGNYLLPKNSLLKLQRQAEFLMLPAGFYPANETETDGFRRKALRYAIAYYRDSEVPGFDDFRDVLLGMRFDTRDGKLEVRYFHVAIIVDPNRIVFPEDRPSLAVLPDAEATALLFFFQGQQQQLLSFEGMFSENPHPANFIGGDDVDGVKADYNYGKFAVFVRGGGARGSLFLILTDATLGDIQTYELLRDLPSSDQAVVFQVLPAASPTFRAAPTSSSTILNPAVNKK
jgi:hypothetical protein